jgi:hypothetical protein
MAKYMMKAASPKNIRLLQGGRGDFIDPILAARAEVAFSGDRLFECLGTWRGADEGEDPPDAAPTSCAYCGSRVWKTETHEAPSGEAGVLPGRREAVHAVAAAGVPLRQVQDWLGHSTITMTMRYSHLAPGHGAELVRALENPSAVANTWQRR